MMETTSQLPAFLEHWRTSTFAKPATAADVADVLTELGFSNISSTALKDASWQQEWATDEEMSREAADELWATDPMAASYATSQEDHAHGRVVSVAVQYDPTTGAVTHWRAYGETDRPWHDLVVARLGLPGMLRGELLDSDFCSYLVTFAQHNLLPEAITPELQEQLNALRSYRRQRCSWLMDHAHLVENLATQHNMSEVGAESLPEAGQQWLQQVTAKYADDPKPAMVGTAFSNGSRHVAVVYDATYLEDIDGVDVVGDGEAEAELLRSSDAPYAGVALLLNDWWVGGADSDAMEQWFVGRSMRHGDLFSDGNLHHEGFLEHLAAAVIEFGLDTTTSAEPPSITPILGKSTAGDAVAPRAPLAQPAGEVLKQLLAEAKQLTDISTANHLPEFFEAWKTSDLAQRPVRARVHEVLTGYGFHNISAAVRSDPGWQRCFYTDPEFTDGPEEVWSTDLRAASYTDTEQDHAWGRIVSVALIYSTDDEMLLAAYGIGSAGHEWEESIEAHLGYGDMLAHGFGDLLASHLQSVALAGLLPDAVSPEFHSQLTALRAYKARTQPLGLDLAALREGLLTPRNLAEARQQDFPAAGQDWFGENSAYEEYCAFADGDNYLGIRYSVEHGYGDNADPEFHVENWWVAGPDADAIHLWLNARTVKDDVSFTQLHDEAFRAHLAAAVKAGVLVEGT